MICLQNVEHTINCGGALHAVIQYSVSFPLRLYNKTPLAEKKPGGYRYSSRAIRWIGAEAKLRAATVSGGVGVH